MTDDESRKAFEHNISSPPYELAIDRYPNDERRYTWPGKYKDYAVRLAWNSWQAAVEWATKRATKPEPEILAMGYIYKVHGGKPNIYYPLTQRDHREMASDPNLIRVRIVRDQ